MENKDLLSEGFHEEDVERVSDGLPNEQEKARGLKNLVASMANTVVNAVDQNGDGKLDKDDITEIRLQLQEKRHREKLLRDLDALNPVFLDDLGRIHLSKMIQIAEKDKKHLESDACIGSIGHETMIKDLRLVTIYPDTADTFGLQFYPDKSQEFYYVNPVNSHQYIAIDHFFDYMRQARVSELEKIAQDLGATHFKVTIGEKASSKNKLNLVHSEKQRARLPLKVVDAKASFQAEHAMISTNYTSVKIESETSFEGHSPEMPQLVYYRNEPKIQNLVSLRLDQRNVVTAQRLELESVQSCGITQKDVAVIEAALSVKKIGGENSLVSNFVHEANKEVRRVFHYEIKF